MFDTTAPTRDVLFRSCTRNVAQYVTRIHCHCITGSPTVERTRGRSSASRGSRGSLRPFTMNPEGALVEWMSFNLTSGVGRGAGFTCADQGG